MTSAKLFSDEAASMFERATSTTLKDSMLLYFAYADFEEGRVKYDRVHQIYQRFLELDNIDPTLVSLFNQNFTSVYFLIFMLSAMFAVLSFKIIYHLINFCHVKLS